MTPGHDSMFDDRIADWLEADPSTAPSQLLQTVVAAVPSIPQRTRRLMWPARDAWSPIRFASAAVVAIALVAFSLVNGPVFGPPAQSPSPSPSPSPISPPPPITLSGETTSFVSPHYGYSLDHPIEWTVRPATESLVEGGAPWIDSPGVDYVAERPVGAIDPGIIVGAAELVPGQTLDAWTDLTTVATCGAPGSRVSIPIDNETGVLLTYPRCFGLRHLWATVIHGTTGFHIVLIGTLGTEAADRRLFDDVVASFHFPAVVPSAGPTAIRLRAEELA